VGLHEIDRVGAAPRSLAKAVVRLEQRSTWTKKHGRTGLSHLIVGGVAKDVVRAVSTPK
jgi:nucleotide-binding universal stress UspA family protein